MADDNQKAINEVIDSVYTLTLNVLDDNKKSIQGDLNSFGNAINAIISLIDPTITPNEGQATTKNTTNKRQSKKETNLKVANKKLKIAGDKIGILQSLLENFLDRYEETLQKVHTLTVYKEMQKKEENLKLFLKKPELAVLNKPRTLQLKTLLGLFVERDDKVKENFKKDFNNGMKNALKDAKKISYQDQAIRNHLFEVNEAIKSQSEANILNKLYEQIGDKFDEIEDKESAREFINFIREMLKKYGTGGDFFELDFFTKATWDKKSFEDAFPKFRGGINFDQIDVDQINDKRNFVLEILNEAAGSSSARQKIDPATYSNNTGIFSKYDIFDTKNVWNAQLYVSKLQKIFFEKQIWEVNYDAKNDVNGAIKEAFEDLGDLPAENHPFFKRRIEVINAYEMLEELYRYLTRYPNYASTLNVYIEKFKNGEFDQLLQLNFEALKKKLEKDKGKTPARGASRSNAKQSRADPLKARFRSLPFI